MAQPSRVIVITGAARGIGLECARRFARRGERVLIADIDEKAGDIAVASIRAEGGEAAFILCDVGDRLHIRNLIAAAIDQYGRVDVLINNAAMVCRKNFLEIEEDEYEAAMRVNLRGPFLASQAAARQMIKQMEAGEDPAARKGYAIINISSVSAVVVVPSQILYALGKGGLNQLTKGMALALAPHGIRVNAIGPGPIDTDPNAELMANERMRAKILERTPLGRFGKPDEIASIAEFLASEGASFITGQCIYADGGRLILNDRLVGGDSGG